MSAVDLLLAARRERRQMAALPEGARPRDMAEAYDLQDRLIARLGDDVVGWKLGVGSAKLKRQSGLGRSIAGRILKSRVFASGASVEPTFDGPVTIEFEIDFVLGEDIRPGDTQPREKIAETRVAIELVQSSFLDRRAAGWPSFAADNSGFEALIPGEKIEPTAIPELLASLVVSVDGETRARAATGEDATDPYIAFDDLVALASERNMVLPRGAFVSTGSASLPFAVPPRGEVTAAYLGQTLNFRLLTPTNLRSAS